MFGSKLVGRCVESKVVGGKAGKFTGIMYPLMFVDVCPSSRSVTRFSSSPNQYMEILSASAMTVLIVSPKVPKGISCTGGVCNQVSLCICHHQH